MPQFTKKKIWISLFGVAISAISASSYAVAPPPPKGSVVSSPATEQTYIIKNADIESSLPKQASEWLEIIKKNNPQLDCPQSSSASCVFLGSVNLDESNGEYEITLKGSSFIDGYIALPQISKVASQEANEKVWFKKVLVNNKEAELIEKNGQLMAGVVKGDFDLKVIVSKNNSRDIASVAFENTPLILVNNIKNKNFIKDGNIVRLAQAISEPTDKNSSVAEEKNLNQEALQINVFRKLNSQIPNILTTKVKITYSGKPRDFFLGKVLPEGFEFNSASSNLKIEKKEDGFWVKLVAGENSLNIEAFLLKNTSNIKVAGLVNSADNEVWSVEQNTNIRQVEVTSNKQLDPKQAMVPNEWSTFPAYLVKDDFSMKDNRRGLEENKNIEMKVNRLSFFGFDKDSMFHVDNMEVKNYGIQFLNKNTSEVNPDSFKIGKQNQVLLNNKDNLGVIIPKGEFSATSHSVTHDSSIPVQFWDGNTSVSNWAIHVAPRMRMFAATGDSIKSYGTWLDHWNLYTVFSVFLIVLAFFKLFGRTTAAMALIGLLLFQTEVFSWALWLSILFILGLQKILPEQSESKFARITNITGFVALGLFILYSLNFIKKEIQLMINPSLELISNHLSFVNPNNYMVHLGILSLIFYFFSNKTPTPIGTPKKSTISLSQAILLFVVSAMFLSLPTLLQVSKDSVLGTGSASVSIQDGGLRTLDGPGPLPAPSSISAMDMKSNSIVSKEFDKQEMVENLMLKKAQVGTGTPSWNNFRSTTYSIESSGATSKESKVHFWIAPVWLVNIFSFIQIAFLLVSIFVFAVGLLHLSNKEDWFNKIPYSIRRSKLVQILLINDLKKGFAK